MSMIFDRILLCELVCIIQGLCICKLMTMTVSVHNDTTLPLPFCFVVLEVAVINPSDSSISVMSIQDAGDETVLVLLSDKMTFYCTSKLSYF